MPTPRPKILAFLLILKGLILAPFASKIIYVWYSIQSDENPIPTYNLYDSDWCRTHLADGKISWVLKRERKELVKKTIKNSDRDAG